MKDSTNSAKYLSSILHSIHNLSLTLKDSTNSAKHLSSILHSIHNLSLTLKDSTNSAKYLSSILHSIHNLSLTLKDSTNSAKHLSSILHYMESLKRLLRSEDFPTQGEEIIKRLADASSSGQLQSKMWLVKTLKEKEISLLGTVFLCAGWYGFLAFLLLPEDDLPIKQIFSFDIDPLSVKISEDLNRTFVKDNWKFKATLKDIFKINYSKDQFETLKANGKAESLSIAPDTIINTSCEHFKNFKGWWSKIPPGKRVILQSNNYFNHKDHTNCISSLKDFKKQAPMNLIYEGILDLKKYKRFMLIGYKL